MKRTLHSSTALRHAWRLHLWMALTFAAVQGHAQRTGQLRLFIDPGHNYSFVLDHRYRMNSPLLTLPEGPHHFTFWAPQRRMVDTTVVVTADSLNSFLLRMPFSAEYEQYRRDLSRFKRQVVWTRAAGITATVGFGIWTFVSWGKARDAQQQLKDDEALYSTLTTPRHITQLKEETIPAHQDDLRRARTNLYIGGTLFAASAVATAYIFRRTRERNVPVFEDKEKMRFDGLVWLPSSTGGLWCASLTVPIR
ncbi:MAG: hypothetical protein JNM31_10100 [Flavobacteriales bacterium]|nr:hypothetical protein [Flavobacteriales bacterium]